MVGMEKLLSSSVVFLWLAFILLLVILHDLLRATLRFSHRLLKFEFPSTGSLRLVAVIQVLLGVLVTLLMRLIHNDPVLDLAVGAAVMLLSGLPLIKALLKYPWKIARLVWMVAAVMQLVFVPVVSLVTLAAFILLASFLFPPQF